MAEDSYYATVLRIDDIGSVLVAWDKGSRLNALYEFDQIKVIK